MDTLVNSDGIDNSGTENERRPRSG